MGKNASKSFINQFKNTRRQARNRPHVEQAGRRPLVGQAGRRPLGGSTRPLKNFFPLKPGNKKNSDRGDK